MLHRHAAPLLPAPGLALVLADASAAPSLPGVFDLVLAPWFVGFAPEPVSRLLPRVNRLLAPGRPRLHHGSLAFAHAARADAVSLEELVALLPRFGFASVEAREAPRPYVASPASGTRAPRASSP